MRGVIIREICSISLWNTRSNRFVGRFDHLKGDIFELSLIFSREYAIQIIMIGRGLTWDNSSLVNLIPRGMTESELFLAGEHEDVGPLLSKCDFLCLPSRAEGFPNVVGEAMMLGLPCVVTDVGDAADLVGDTGFVVEAENSFQLADALLRMIRMGVSSRVALGRQAKDRVIRNFSHGDVVQSYEQLYLKLAGPQNN